MMDIKKRGLSTVIATVLILMLTISMVAILYGLIIPMIREQLEKAKFCNDARGALEIETDPEFSCHNPSNTTVMIKLSSSEMDLKGILISLKSKESAEVYTLKSNTIVLGVAMKNQEPSVPLELPQKGGAKSYVFNLANSTSIEVAAIVGSKLYYCDSAEEKIEQC